MPRTADRVAETTTTTGTGAITLAGAKTAYRAFSAAFAVGDSVYYAIAGGAEWEVGVGTLGAGTLSRDTILASSNAGAAVALSAGSKDVFCTAPSRQLSGGTVDVPFNAAVKFTGNEQMAQQTVAGPIAFTADVAGAIDGAVVQVDLIANGTHTPTFAATFRQWGGSMNYDNRTGLRNSITFFRRSGVYYYAITQVVGAVAEPVAIAPTFSVAPAIIGTPAVGAASAFTAGTVNGSPVPAVTTQWLLNDVAISGATGANYTPVSGDSGGTLKVRQTATNASGSASSTSAGVVVAAALAVPGAPTALAPAAVSLNSVQLTWGAPVTGGGSITDYVVQRAAAGTSFAAPTTFVDGTSAVTGATVTGLTGETAYDFRVAAVNAAGQGAWVELLNVTTSGVDSLIALTDVLSLTESPAKTYTSTNAGAWVAGGAAGSLGIDGDGYISMDYSVATNCMLCFDGVVNSLWNACDRAVYVIGGSIAQSTNGGGSSTIGTITAGAGTRIRLRRSNFATTPVWTVETTTDSGATWTTIYTYAGTYPARMYPKWFAGVTGNKIVNPRAQGLA